MMSAHYVMKNDQNGTSSFETVAGPEFSSTDYDGWEGLSIEVAGIFAFIFKVSPDAVEYPLHASPDCWLGYVIQGEGVLYSGNKHDEKTGSVAFKQGDFITFEPNTQHAWTNGTLETKILFVKQA